MVSSAVVSMSAAFAAPTARIICPAPTRKAAVAAAVVPAKPSATTTTKPAAAAFRLSGVAFGDATPATVSELLALNPTRATSSFSDKSSFSGSETTLAQERAYFVALREARARLAAALQANIRELQQQRAKKNGLLRKRLHRRNRNSTAAAAAAVVAANATATCRPCAGSGVVGGGRDSVPDGGWPTERIIPDPTVCASPVSMEGDEILGEDKTPIYSA